MKVACVCQKCKRVFYVKASYLKQGGNRGVYCSKACRKTGEYRICQKCGERFWLKRSELKRGLGKFCSERCAGNESQGLITRVCKACGRKFEIRKKQLKSSKFRGDYCSRKCAGTIGAVVKEYRCPRCRTVFERRVSRKGPTGPIQFCNNHCKYLAMRRRAILECTCCHKRQEVRTFDPRLKQKDYRCRTCRIPDGIGSIGFCPGCLSEFQRELTGQIHCRPECFSSPMKKGAVRRQTNHVRRFFGMGKRRVDEASKKRLAQLQVAGRLVRGSVSEREAKQMFWLIEKGLTHVAYITKGDRTGRCILRYLSRKSNRIRRRNGERIVVQAASYGSGGCDATETDAWSDEGSVLSDRARSEKELVAAGVQARFRGLT